MSTQFEGRIALVTGAGQGMGLGVARRLSELGAQVLLNDIDAEKAEAAAQEIVASGGKAVALPFDITNIEQTLGIVKQMISSPELAGKMVDSVSAELANTAWKLRLNAKGHVEWLDIDKDGGEEVFDRAPQSTGKQRFEAGITDINAVEGQL